MILTGIVLFYFSRRKEKIERPAYLPEVSGIIGDHSFTHGRNFKVNHFFWLKGYACTFRIPSNYAYLLDQSIFGNSYQDQRQVIVAFDPQQKKNVNERDAIVTVKLLRSGNKIYYDEFSRSENRLIFWMFIKAIILTTTGAVFLILYLADALKKPGRNSVMRQP